VFARRDIPSVLTSPSGEGRIVAPEACPPEQDEGNPPDQLDTRGDRSEST
jgi:hypothetical protein